MTPHEQAWIEYAKAQAMLYGAAEAFAADRNSTYAKNALEQAAFYYASAWQAWEDFLDTPGASHRPQTPTDT